ncbi:SDR family oxidoreductase [Actinomadura macrotermitis]|uniref:Putative oxidoreductase n=1 Tax=Actinomadura macrotermitis TaxID=2585200 RepID=A0A7K0BQH2_9ACTN|nr:SDR family oxidoreductase [Actinomadura macrotermitis]MQY03423.1 putative oxidoreductase [Actinomadura macrotermitis]
MSTQNDTLAGRVAVVTGASSGIGAATARLLAARGAKVALLARRADRLEALAAETGGVAIPVDVTDADAVLAAAERVADRLGPADLVLNNAGVMLPAPLEQGRSDLWQRMIEVNLTGALRVVDAFVPDLVKAAADGRPADLFNISSIAATMVFPSFAAYCATKAAISHYSRNLRAELGPKDVRVTNIEPGIVRTELGDHITDPGAAAWLAQTLEAGVAIEDTEVAEVIAFAAARPRHVNLSEITVLPTRQVAA